jgi:lipoprotein Spr
MMRKYWVIIVLLVFLTSCEGGKNIVSNTDITTNDDVLLVKYAQIIGVSKSEIKNAKLYSFIDDWYGTKYKYGGMSKLGVDCSGFCNILYNYVYNKSLKRKASDIANDVSKVSKETLVEGDLIFFNISNKNSHVGIYLMNNKFVHASTSKGVLISSLDNPYYKKNYNKGGRL